MSQECPFILVTNWYLLPPFLSLASLSRGTQCCPVFPLPPPAHASLGGVFGAGFGTRADKHTEKSYLPTTASLFLCLSMNFMGIYSSLFLTLSSIKVLRHIFFFFALNILSTICYRVCVCVCGRGVVRKENTGREE